MLCLWIKKKHIIPILRLLINKKIRVGLHTPNGLHPRYIDEELANLLWGGGFGTLRLSFEGLSQRVQDASGGKVSSDDLENALNCLRNIEDDTGGRERRCHPSWDIGVYILMGLPDQSFDEIVDTMRYVNSIGGKIKLTQYSPVPGTKEFQRAKQLCPDIVEEPLAHNNSTFSTIGMGIDHKAVQELKSLAGRLNMKVMR